MINTLGNATFIKYMIKHAFSLSLGISPRAIYTLARINLQYGTREKVYIRGLVQWKLCMVIGELVTSVINLE